MGEGQVAKVLLAVSAPGAVGLVSDGYLFNCKRICGFLGNFIDLPLDCAGPLGGMCACPAWNVLIRSVCVILWG